MNSSLKMSLPKSRRTADDRHPESPGTNATPRRFGGDDGAALVELALVAPVLILLLFAMAEVGLAWRTSTSTADAVRQATLDASSPAGDRYGDLNALETIVANLDPDNIQYVTIYDTTDPGGQAPAGCTTGSVPGVCNRYSPADLVRVANGTVSRDTLDETTCSGAFDADWCPLDRTTGGQLGIQIRLEHEYITGIVPGSGIVTIDDHATFPLLGA